jgi:UDP-glucose 4-epimerase
MLNALKSGDSPVVHGDGSQAFDFVDVRDCARANVLAMQTASTDAFYNVGTGIKTSIADLAAMLVALWGESREVRFVESDRHYVRNRIGSTRQAESGLGFKAGIDLQAGLADLVAWHRGSAS